MTANLMGNCCRSAFQTTFQLFIAKLMINFFFDNNLCCPFIRPMPVIFLKVTVIPGLLQLFAFKHNKIMMCFVNIPHFHHINTFSLCFGSKCIV